MSFVHHHLVVPLARVSLTLSRHFSLSLIASGRSSGLHPVSSHSCWMYVRAGRPASARLYVGVHRSTSFMSSSLLLQQYPAYLIRLTWIVFVMGGRWPYSWCLVGCCRQDLVNIARSILVLVGSNSQPLYNSWGIIAYVWFGLVLWHINHFWLFKAKSSLHIWIRYILFENISQQPDEFDTRPFLRRVRAQNSSQDTSGDYKNSSDCDVCSKIQLNNRHLLQVENQKVPSQIIQFKLINCLNFWDEAWWFLSLRVFWLLFSPLLYSRTHSVTVIGVGSLSFLGDNHLEVAGSILTAGE